MSVIGLGSPIVDLVMPVDEEFLSNIEGDRGGMRLIDYQTIEQLIASGGECPSAVAGGSAANTLRGLSGLGTPAALLGVIGQDPYGEQFLGSLAESGVAARLLRSSEPTSLCLSLVGPEGDRTMRTYLGASKELSPGHLDGDCFAGSSHLHLEGYLLYLKGVVQRAVSLAKAQGLTISLDLASFEVVRTFLSDIQEILTTGLDIVFGNELEIEALFGVGREAGCARLASQTQVAVVMMGKEGAFVGSKGGCHHYPAEAVSHVVDSTGAGDLFAAGFLHAYLKGQPLEKCAALGAKLGAAVVQQVGAVLPKSQLVGLGGEA